MYIYILACNYLKYLKYFQILVLYYCNRIFTVYKLNIDDGI